VRWGPGGIGSGSGDGGRCSGVDNNGSRWASPRNDRADAIDAAQAATTL